MRNLTSITLHQATAEDVPLFYRLIDETMRGLIISTWGAWDEEQVRREAEEFSRSRNGQVIRLGAIAVGVLVVDREPAQIVLRQLYLLPEHQRKGVGTFLVKQLLDEASREHLPLRLRVIAKNPAVRFYEKFPFVVIRSEPDFVYMERAA